MVYFEVDELEKGSVVVGKNGVYNGLNFEYTGEKFGKIYIFKILNSPIMSNGTHEIGVGEEVYQFTRSELMDNFEVVY